MFGKTTVHGHRGRKKQEILFCRSPWQLKPKQNLTKLYDLDHNSLTPSPRPPALPPTLSESNAETSGSSEGRMF